MAALSDKQIIQGICQFVDKITNDYFYGYCKPIYRVYAAKNHFKEKIGLDFYSLAHDYYLRLHSHHFQQLLLKNDDVSLSSWLANGFRFVIQEAISKANKQNCLIDNNYSVDFIDCFRSSDIETGMMSQVLQAVSAYYSAESTMTTIARMHLVEGYTQKEIAQHLGITPSAVNQRIKKMMDRVIVPYIVENYGEGISAGHTFQVSETPLERGIPSSSSFLGFRCALPSQPVIARRVYSSPAPFVTFPLRPEQVLVFGTNLAGIHYGKVGRMAVELGAQEGCGVGLSGQTYAIPIMQGGVDTIRPYVDEFIGFAAARPEYQFLVADEGYGIAGFELSDIAPLYAAAVRVDNIHLSRRFVLALR